VHLGADARVEGSHDQRGSERVGVDGTEPGALAGIVEDVEVGSPELVSRGLHCGGVRDLELDADSLNEATLHSSAPKQACTT
jgi:hypothetical protein